MIMRISVKLWGANKKRVYSHTSTKRALLLARLRTRPFQKGYIMVNYGNKHYNDSYFDNLEDGKWYLTNFTEINLVRTLQNG